MGIRGDGEGEGKDPRARMLGSFLLITKNLSKLEKIIVNNTEIQTEFNVFNNNKKNAKLPFCAFELRLSMQFKRIHSFSFS